MCWQPRALKKRESEFNVAKPEDDGAAGSAAPLTASTATSSAASSSSAAPADNFKGAADLDDLDDAGESNKGAKRARTDGGESNPEEAAAAPPPPVEKKEKGDEIIEAAPRLAAHIMSNGKFNKVAAMAYALIEGGRVKSGNAGAFFSVLEAGMRDPLRLRDSTYRVATRKLYSAAVSRAAMFPLSCADALKRWEIQVVVHCDLFTDDTFQFNAAAKRVRETLIGLPCIYPALEPAPDTKHLPENERRAWAEVLFQCVGSAMMHHKYLWARTTCDMLVKFMVDRRQNFTEEQQAEIQSWNAKCKGQKVVRQQEHSKAAAREQTAFERKEQEWKSAAISTSDGGGQHGAGLDGWCAKQGLN